MNNQPFLFEWPVPPQGVEVVTSGLKNGRRGRKETIYLWATLTQLWLSSHPDHICSIVNVQEMGDLTKCLHIWCFLQSSEHTNRGNQKAQRINHPASKWLRPVNNVLLNFHIDYLISLLKDKSKVADVVELQQQAIQMVNARAKPHLLEWHVECLKKSMPNKGRCWSWLIYY